MMPAPTGAIVKLSDNFTETEIDGEVVVMMLDTGEFYSMTGTGCDIWRMIDGSRDRDAVVAGLAGEFDADPAAIGVDVDSYLAMLREAGLVAFR